MRCMIIVSLTVAYDSFLTINRAISTGVSHASFRHGLDTRQAIVVVHIAVKILRQGDRENGKKAEQKIHDEILIGLIDG